MHESKAELTDRLRREGRWDAFKQRREQLRASGVPAKEAWRQAAAEFPAPEYTSKVIVPSIPWAKARKAVQEAETDHEWLLTALHVKLPRSSRADLGLGNSIALRTILRRFRENPTLVDRLYTAMLEKSVKGNKFWGTSLGYDPTLKLDMREWVGKGYRPR